MTIKTKSGTEGIDNRKLERHIWDHKDLSSTQKLVALCIAKHRNCTHLQCNPSEGSIAKQTGLVKRTVIRAVKDLEKAGEIIVHRQRRGPKGRGVNHYLFTYDARKAYEAENLQTDLSPKEYEMLCKLHA